MWLSIAWLSASNHLPDRDDSDFTERLFELGDAAGTLGKAAAISVAAYLLGSLMRSVLDALAALSIYVLLPAELPTTPAGPRRKTISAPWTLSEVLDEVEPRQGDEWDATPATLHSVDEETMDRLTRLIQSETEVAWRNLRTVASRRDVTVRLVDYKPGRVTVTRDDDSNEHVVQGPPSPGDVVDQLGLIRSRLSEQSEPLAQNVDRLIGEADFRLVIAPPATVLTLLAADGLSPAAFLLLIVPTVLTLQAFSLRREANRELVDVLRSRQGTPDLEQLTPVFRVFRETTDRLARTLTETRRG